MTAGHEPRGWAWRCQLIGGIGLVAVAVARCVIAFTPQLVFDVDPAVDALRFGGLGPAGSLWLDVILLAFGGVALLGVAETDRGLDWRLLILAAVPLPIVIIHGATDAGDLWRGSAWAAAMVGAVTMAHLARDRTLRPLLAAALVAVIAPLLVRGALQVWYEHPNTVALFEQTKETYLRNQGWAPGSPSALIYERRLRQPAPNAWFLSTNVLASLCAFGCVAGVGLTIAAFQWTRDAGRQRTAALVVGMMATFACALGLALTRSKGGLGVALCGIALLLLVPTAQRRWPRRQALVGLGNVAIIAMVLLALVAVAARGALLPEGFGGDRSLLFRWHYLVGSSRIVTEHPWTGVGPDQFQQAYMAVRPARSPEQVTSAHSIFADWLTMLGVAGLGWVALALVMLWRSGREPIEDDPACGPGRSLPTLLPVIGCSAGLLAGVLIERHVVDPVGAMSRVIGVVLYIAGAAAVAHFLRSISWSRARWALAAGVAAVIMHAQIELTMFDPAAVTWIGCMLGLVAGATPRWSRGPALLAAAAVLGASLWLAVAGAVPASRQQQQMAEAAALLEPVGTVRWQLQYAASEPDALRRGSALLEVDRSLRALADPATVDELGLAATADFGGALSGAQRAGIDAIMAPVVRQRRLAAADALVRSHQLMPSSGQPLEAAAQQLLALAKMTRPPSPELLEQAGAVIEQAIASHTDGSAIALAGTIHTELALASGDPAAWERAIAYARRLTEIDPHGNMSFKRLGDTLYASGDRTAAATAYRQALAANDNFELDPLVQFADRDRAVIESRIAEGGG